MLLTNLVRVGEVRKRLPDNDTDWNPLFYFALASGIVNVIFNIRISLTIFRKQEQIGQIVTFLKTTDLSHESEQVFKVFAY